MKGPEEREQPSACSAEWLVEKSRQAIELGDQFAAKSWLLTAKTLYPNSFSVQYEAFQMERRHGQLATCGKLFFDMIKSFPHEEIIWNELRLIVQSQELNTSELDNELLFFKEMAESLPMKYQRELLLKYADHQGDIVEKCRISLVVMKKFHGGIKQYGLKLTELLMKAEEDDSSLAPLNMYRKMLVCDVLPVILKSTEIHLDAAVSKHKTSMVYLPEELFLKWLELTTELYLSYNIQQTNLKHRHLRKQSMTTIFEDDNMLRHNTWQSIFDSFLLFAAKCGWNHLLKVKDKIDPSRNKSMKSKWKTLNNIKDPKSTRGVFYSVLQLLFQAAIEYCSIMTNSQKGQRDAECNDFILLEMPDSFGSNQQPPQSTVKSPKKKRKIDEASISSSSLDAQLSAEAASLHYVSGMSSQVNDLTELLQVAGDCKQYLTSNEMYEKEYSRILRDWKVNEWDWMEIFDTDSLVYQRRYDEVIAAIKEIISSQNSVDYKSKQYLAKQYTRLAMCLYCIGEQKEACEMALNAIFSISNSQNVNQIAERRMMIRNSSDGRCFQVVQCCLQEIIGFNIELLMAYLKERLANVDFRPDKDKIGPLYEIRQDSVIGHLIVLLQFNWPKREALFEQLVKTIKTLGGLTYEKFFKYVTNIDILEEFAFLNNMETVQLELQENSPGESSRKTVTRGVNRENKEDFRTAMDIQVARCDESIQDIILQFLTDERLNLLSHG